MSYIEQYNRWINNKRLDNSLKTELGRMDNDSIEDAFYKNLEFGTGGLRGLIGPGSNRMNIYSVAKATQGIVEYIKAHYEEEKRIVAISRDSRLLSDVFSETVARVFAANGIKVCIYPYISPVPTLSFAIRYLNCCLGVMITASHNPSVYNGYKVYGNDGCQITTEAAKEMLSYIDKVDIFDGYKIISFDEGFKQGLVEYIKPDVLTAYIEEVKKQSFLGNEKVNKDIAIVYTPLNGTGLYPIKRALNELGYTNIQIVKEQEFPNGYFPTCKKPNPEEKEALALGIEYCKKYDADLLLGTDPDCDRIGVALKDKDGSYVLLSGNELGLLLFNYICERRIALGTMPNNPVMAKTIATIDLAEALGNDYGVSTINVLTGFKFIGEQIGLLEKNGRLNDYIFGFEDSYGVLSGTYVRDKDAVNGACLVCEMFVYYKSKGLSLLDKLNEIWNKYGYSLTTLRTFEFVGPKGQETMNNVMSFFRDKIQSVCDMPIVNKIDYINGLDGLPKSNVLKFILDCGSIVLRPSGTEPKLKAYISICASTKDDARKIENDVYLFLENIINS